MKEVCWNPDRTVMNENSMSEGILLYKYFLHRYYLGVQKGQQKRKVVLSKIVPEEILKIKYCIVWKKEKEKKNYICLLKRNIISIRATGVILVIKRNSNKNSEKMKLLTHI